MSTIPTTDKNYFNGGQNINSGGRAGNDQILPEILTIIKSKLSSLEDNAQLVIPSHTIYVDISSSATIENGSIATPYKSIQAAIDYADTLVGADIYKPARLRIAPGLYQEDLILKSSNTVILEGSGAGSVFIYGTTGPALTVTNATLESLDTYRSSGTYSDLDPEATPVAGPQGLLAKDIFFGTFAANTNAVEFLGVKGDTEGGDATDFGGANFYLCSMIGDGTGVGIYARNSSGLSAVGIGSYADITMINVKTSIFQECVVGDYSLLWNAADPNGKPTGVLGNHRIENLRYGAGTITIEDAQLGVWGGLNSHGDFIVNGTGELLLYGVDNRITGFDVNDTGEVTIYDGSTNGDVDIEAGASFAAYNHPIFGDFTVAAGAGVVTLENSPVSGLITDAGSKIVHSRSGVRAGVITATGAGDEVVSFATNFPTTKYIVSVTCEDTGSGIGSFVIKNGTLAVGGFTLTVGGAAKYHWKAELLG